MRGILFRGKRIDNSEWIEGYLLISRDALCNDYRTYIAHKPDEPFGAVGDESIVDNTAWINHIYEVDLLSIGQCAGTDKNGKKIFEGDIVRTRTGKIFEVAFIECYSRFALKRPGTVFGWSNLKLCEVIGNIRDNPELLEAEA